MIRPPPKSTRTDTLLPDTTLFRSGRLRFRPSTRDHLVRTPVPVRCAVAAHRGRHDHASAFRTTMPVVVHRPGVGRFPAAQRQPTQRDAFGPSRTHWRATARAVRAADAATPDRKSGV